MIGTNKPEYDTRLEKLASDKHSNFLSQFLIYEEKKVLWPRALKRGTTHRATI